MMILLRTIAFCLSAAGTGIALLVAWRALSARNHDRRTPGLMGIAARDIVIAMFCFIGVLAPIRHWTGPDPVVIVMRIIAAAIYVPYAWRTLHHVHLDEPRRKRAHLQHLARAAVQERRARR